MVDKIAHIIQMICIAIMSLGFGVVSVLLVPLIIECDTLWDYAIWCIGFIIITGASFMTAKIFLICIEDWHTL